MTGLSSDHQQLLSDAIAVHRDEVKQRGGTHNDQDRRAALWELGTAALMGGSLAAAASGVPVIKSGRLPIVNIGAAALAGGGAIAAQYRANRHHDAAEVIRRLQFPQLYDENGNFIKVALFAPGPAMFKNMMGWRGELGSIIHSNRFSASPAVLKTMSRGTNGIKGSAPMFEHADKMDFLATRGAVPRASADRAARAAVVRKDRLRFVGENQWQKPALQARAGFNQIVAKAKNFRIPEPAARPIPNFAPAV